MSLSGKLVADIKLTRVTKTFIGQWTA